MFYEHYGGRAPSHPSGTGTDRYASNTGTNNGACISSDQAGSAVSDDARHSNDEARPAIRGATGPAGAVDRPARVSDVVLDRVCLPRATATARGVVAACDARAEVNTPGGTARRALVRRRWGRWGCGRRRTGQAPADVHRVTPSAPSGIVTRDPAGQVAAVDRIARVHVVVGVRGLNGVDAREATGARVVQPCAHANQVAGALLVALVGTVPTETVRR
jgi:hypothetical protein